MTIRPWMEFIGMHPHNAGSLRSATTAHLVIIATVTRYFEPCFTAATFDMYVFRFGGLDWPSQVSSRQMMLCHVHYIGHMVDSKSVLLEDPCYTKHKYNK